MSSSLSSSNCGEVGETQAYQFVWMVDHASNPPQGFTPSTTTIDFDLSEEEHTALMMNNNGEYPILWGRTEEEASDMLFADYIYGSSLPPQRIVTCLCENEKHVVCFDSVKRYNILWKYCDRGKYGRTSYFRILPLYLCENHFAHILKQHKITSQTSLIATGWDYWDAVDSIIGVISFFI